MALSLDAISQLTSRIARQLHFFTTNVAATATPVGGDVALFYDASDNYEPKYMTLTQGASAGNLGNTYALTLDIPVIGDEAVYYMYVPYAGTITTIISVIDAAISTPRSRRPTPRSLLRLGQPASLAASSPSRSPARQRAT